MMSGLQGRHTRCQDRPAVDKTNRPKPSRRGAGARTSGQDSLSRAACRGVGGGGRVAVDWRVVP